MAINQVQGAQAAGHLNTQTFNYNGCRSKYCAMCPHFGRKCDESRFARYLTIKVAPAELSSDESQAAA